MGYGMYMNCANIGLDVVMTSKSRKPLGFALSATTGCLKFMAFRGLILNRVQSFSFPRTDLIFRHLILSGCDTIT